MKRYILKIRTIRHLNQNDYQEYKQMMRDEVDFEELERYGIYVLRTAKPDEDVRSVFELSVVDEPK